MFKIVDNDIFFTNTIQSDLCKYFATSLFCASVYDKFEFFDAEWISNGKYKVMAVWCLNFIIFGVIFFFIALSIWARILAVGAPEINLISPNTTRFGELWMLLGSLTLQIVEMFDVWNYLRPMFLVFAIWQQATISIFLDCSVQSWFCSIKICFWWSWSRFCQNTKRNLMFFIHKHFYIFDIKTCTFEKITRFNMTAKLVNFERRNFLDFQSEKLLWMAI